MTGLYFSPSPPPPPPSPNSVVLYPWSNQSMENPPQNQQHKDILDQLMFFDKDSALLQQQQVPQLALRQPPQLLLDFYDGLNLRPTGINMLMNRMEHNSHVLFRTPAPLPFIWTRLYKSVWRTDSGQSVVKIRLRWNWVSIDTCDNTKEAALARDRATFKLRGEKALLNYRELFVIENRAEPKASPSSEIQLPPTAQQEDPDEDSALGWSEARGNDEVEAVGIRGEVRREAERAEAGLNSGCLRKGKRKVKTPGGDWSENCNSFGGYLTN